MSYFLACLVVRDLCRSGCGQNYYLIPVQSADCTLEKQLSTQEKLDLGLGLGLGLGLDLGLVSAGSNGIAP